jgi:hypothetical protein
MDLNYPVKRKMIGKSNPCAGPISNCVAQLSRCHGLANTAPMGQLEWPRGLLNAPGQPTNGPGQDALGTHGPSGARMARHHGTVGGKPALA